MLNPPLGDTLALRVVGTDTHRSGCIDRVVLNPFPADTTARGNVVAAPVQSIDHGANTEESYWVAGAFFGDLHSTWDDGQ